MAFTRTAPAARAHTTWRTVEVRLLVIAGLAVFVIGVYVVVVLGVGAVFGSADSPDLALSVLATACVALGFAPVQQRLEIAASTLVRGASVTPYDVLRSFSETVSGAYATEELAPRMAKLLMEGTCVRWAQIWLTVDGQPVLAATWPRDAEGAPGEIAAPPQPLPGLRDGTGVDRRALPVRHAGELLGFFVLQERPGQPLSSVEERLATGLAAQAGQALRLAGLRALLTARHAELAARADELRTSRQRLIEAQDAARRRLERDIHDGAQQHLVALAVNLRLVETLAQRSPDRARGVLSQQADAAREALATLTHLARGIYPRLLTDEGLVPALRSSLAVAAVPVRIDASDLPRLPRATEAALYFCCMEAVQNAAKHSAASLVTVTVSVRGSTVALTVADDGTGFDPARAEEGAGMTNMRDRIDAAGGRLVLSAQPGGGTRVEATVPVPRLPEPRSA